MTNPEHWPGCWNCGPAHYECAIEEIKRLVDESHANMMRAAALEPEITRLRTLTTPQPIKTAPKDGTHILIHGNDGWLEDWWSDQYETWLNADVPTHWLPLPEKLK